MAYLDQPPGRRRSRARQDDAAPEAYPADPYPADQYPADQYPAEEHPAGDGHLAYRTTSGTDDAPVAPHGPDRDDEPVIRNQTGKRRAEAKPNGRAGRNLPAAISVGAGLGGAVLATLFLSKRYGFSLLVLAAVLVGIWEMVRAVRTGRGNPPPTPLLVGGAAMIGLAWNGGADALTLGLLATLLAVFVWRLADGPAHYQRDVTISVLIAGYVPFLGAFAILLATPDDGAFRVLVTILAVVLSDTGGYVAGVFFGRRPMAPSVSPKKSWEGFAGSVVITALGSSVALHFLLDAAWWHGIVFGIAVSIASVLGDLGESLIKRDLGVKDMSNLLPGHGGLMDRLDSILLALPTAYAVMALLTPPS